MLENIFCKNILRYNKRNQIASHLMAFLKKYKKKSKINRNIKERYLIKAILIIFYYKSI